MYLKDLTEAIEKEIPLSYAESWDNVGLLVGRCNREVKKVYIALDAGSEAVASAVDKGCDLILTHHPLLFSAVKRVRDDDFIGSRIIDMIENNISYYAMHTNFDVAVMGRICAEKAGIKTEAPLEITGENEDKPIGIGIVGVFEKEMTLREAALLIKERFDLPDVRYFGDPDTKVRKAAMCPGSGKSCDAGAYAYGADVYITGDIDHHYGIDSVEKGLCVIDAGHHGLEHIYVDYMKEWMEEHFPELIIIADENHSPFHVV